MIRTLKGVAVALALLLPNVTVAKPTGVLQPGPSIYMACLTEEGAAAVATAIADGAADWGMSVALDNHCLPASLKVPFTIRASYTITVIEFRGESYEIWMAEAVSSKNGATAFLLGSERLGPEPSGFRI